VTIDADELEIVALGARGDGIAQAPAGPRYVPFALPGELWRLTGDGGELLRPHPARATPPCGHFGACGGCVAQHMPVDTYAAWKRDTVVQAFRHRGIDPPVTSLWRIAPASRRRITLHARRQGGHVRLGFHRAATHDILDVTECAVAVPRIVAALPALREMLGPVLSGRSEAAITVVATAAGLDVHMTFTHLANPSSHYPALAVLGARQGLARLTVGNDIVLQAARPVLVFGGLCRAAGGGVRPGRRGGTGEDGRDRAGGRRPGQARCRSFCGLGASRWPLHAAPRCWRSTAIPLPSRRARRRRAARPGLAI
jgi:23S rRNA (uracil1939-C5)-methyltransferase